MSGIDYRSKPYAIYFATLIKKPHANRPEILWHRMQFVPTDRPQYQDHKDGIKDWRRTASELGHQGTLFTEIAFDRKIGILNDYIFYSDEKHFPPYQLPRAADLSRDLGIPEIIAASITWDRPTPATTANLGREYGCLPIKAEATIYQLWDSHATALTGELPLVVAHTRLITPEYSLLPDEIGTLFFSARELIHNNVYYVEATTSSPEQFNTVIQTGPIAMDDKKYAGQITHNKSENSISFVPSVAKSYASYPSRFEVYEDRRRLGLSGQFQPAPGKTN